MKRYQGGFIDPLSLLSLGFLLLTLVVTTTVTSNTKVSQDLKGKAMSITGRCPNGNPAPDGDLSLCIKKTPAPTQAPIPTPLLDSISIPTITTPPIIVPTSTSTPTPVSGKCCPNDPGNLSQINTCTELLNSRCSDFSYCSWLFSCPTPVPTSTPIPGRCCPNDSTNLSQINTCTGLSNPRCHDFSYCSWNPNDNCFQTTTPAPTVAPTLAPTKLPTQTTTCNVTYINDIGCGQGGCASGEVAQNWKTVNCTEKVRCVASSSCATPTPSPSPSPLQSSSTNTLALACKTCNLNKQCVSQVKPCNEDLNQCATHQDCGTVNERVSTVDNCNQGLSYCVDSSTVAVCKTDESGYINTPCKPDFTCDSNQNRCVLNGGSLIPTTQASPFCSGPNDQKMSSSYTCVLTYKGTFSESNGQGCCIMGTAPNGNQTCSIVSKPTCLNNITPECNGSLWSCSTQPVIISSTPDYCSGPHNRKMSSSRDCRQIFKGKYTETNGQGCCTISPSNIGFCDTNDQCAKDYTCLNKHCVNNNSVEKCARDANVLAHANVAGIYGQTLDSTYVPSGLVNLKNSVPEASYANYDISIQQDAIGAIQGFVDEMIQNGYIPHITYGYRSYETQEGLYQANPGGTAEAGNSQHQTGLAIDIQRYGKIDSQGNIQWFEACTSAIPECESTHLAISIAAKYGIAHPMGWDAPHFFVASAACPGIVSYVQSAASPTSTYYDELNAQIVKIQQSCLSNL